MRALPFALAASLVAACADTTDLSPVDLASAAGNGGHGGAHLGDGGTAGEPKAGSGGNAGQAAGGHAAANGGASGAGVAGSSGGAAGTALGGAGVGGTDIGAAGIGGGGFSGGVAGGGGSGGTGVGGASIGGTGGSAGASGGVGGSGGAAGGGTGGKCGGMGGIGKGGGCAGSAGQSAGGQSGAAGQAGAAGEAGAGGGAVAFPDFHLPGTQAGTLDPTKFFPPQYCQQCHAAMPASPYPTWSGSLMGLAGRDPLFFAQMTTANQDVPSAGYFCMRCHVPFSYVSGTALDPTGNSLTDTDRNGVTCHLCHSLVDPKADPATSPVTDPKILAALPEVPKSYGNSMMVIDPDALRRGPYTNAMPPHPATYSPFMKSGNLCGTCHDVGNPAVSRNADGTYSYNAPNQPPPTDDPESMFPLERTYTEWKLSAFANGGVDMGGVFGGDGVTVVSTCQDCHMPKTKAAGCIFGPTRNDLAKHEFAGASAWAIGIIGQFAQGSVDPKAIQRGQDNAVAMLQRAATLETTIDGGYLDVRVVNQSGHKLPTGHIEGRRVWVNVVFFDANGAVVVEYGHYDPAQAVLDDTTTTVFEMHVGLSAAASAATGLPEGRTTHMALADTVVKDNRIPPRGFDPATYEPVGSGAVGATYAAGQHWADLAYAIPPGAVKAGVTVYYQTVTREYVEALKNGNHTDQWGQTLYDLWTASAMDPPIAIVSADVGIP